MSWYVHDINSGIVALQMLFPGNLGDFTRYLRLTDQHDIVSSRPYRCRNYAAEAA